MHTLRTPNNLPGPNLGIPNLTIRRWYEAQYGRGSWNKMGLIPKNMWAEYLRWYRRVLEIDVLYETKVLSIDYDSAADCFVILAVQNGNNNKYFARRIVLANGIEGSGEWHTPSFISDNLPGHVWAHTSEDIDFNALEGKRIGVLGAGASAFDNAAVSLEAGAASVDLCFRRKELVRVNTFRWAEYMGFLKHFPDLSDSEKWRFIYKINEIGQLPPHDTYHRAIKFPEFTVRPSCGWISAEYSDSSSRPGITVQTEQGEFRYDYVIAATGFRTDLKLRPEFKSFAGKALLWKDCYIPEGNLASDDLARHPYLGQNFELQPKKQGEDEWLRRIFNYTYGALLSFGFSGASITGMKYSLDRVVHGITKSFFLEQRDYHFRSLCDYNVQEF